MSVTLVLELVVLLAAIAIGARAGGVGMGLWGGVGLAILVFGFGAAPGSIPGEVLLIILTVIMAASAMEAAGGIDYLVRIAAAIIRKSPKNVTIIAPVVAYVFTFLAGTGHIFYPLLPVIYEVAMKGKVRPERPIAVSTIASQQAITASPVSAATAALIALLGAHGIGLAQILMICVPSTLIGVIVAALVQTRVGVELEQDPEYQRRLAAGEIDPRETSPETVAAPLPPRAGLSAWMFLAGVGIVVACGLFPVLRTIRSANPPATISMPVTIAIVMFTIAALMLMFTTANGDQIVKTKTCQAGITAVIGILGLAWLGDTFIANNKDAIVGGLSNMARNYPATFSLGLFVTSMLLYSQAVTTRTLMPLGLTLGIPAASLAGMFPAVNGYFFIPTYGTLIAAVNFDRSGTTRIGKYVLNHSFMLPGLVSTTVAVTTGLIIAKVFFERDRRAATMINLIEKLETPARAMGVPVAELAAIAERGKVVSYDAGACLFHESTPRQWLGLVVGGEVDVVRGLHGRQTHLATLTDGAMVSEGILLDDCAHSTSAFAKGGSASVLQVPLAVLEQVKAQKPDVYYRLVARIARRINDRLRAASDMLADRAEAAPHITSYRAEHDSLGEREIPNNAYYGVQTVRALENFAISGVPLRNFAHFVNALAYVKKAAAQANAELGCLPADVARCIVEACDEILAGKLHEQFVVDMFQGGAGTSTNMNANEVIANRGLELMGHAKGEYKHLHPNDHVNCSQSTNDAYPTAIKLAVIFALKDTLAAMGELKASLERKEKEFAGVLKMGRTENQDAVPMTLGQEFGAYAVMIGGGMAALARSAEEFYELNMGATAIGTGINSPPGYADLVTKRLAEATGLPLKKAPNLVEATQDSGAFCQVAATMKRAAVQISKICNDLRWLSSGPRCGLNEIHLPPMQPGSSIMPGKVNPVIPEAVSQICYQIIGYDVTISMASEASELELNMAEPIIAYDLLHGLMILRNACVTLAARCIDGIRANEERCRFYVTNSIGLVTALNPVIGYERSASIAKEALATGGSVYDLVLQKGWLTKERLDDLLSPANMTDPRQLPE